MVDFFAYRWLTAPVAPWLALWIAGWWFLGAASQLYLGRRRGDWLILAGFVGVGISHLFVATFDFA